MINIETGALDNMDRLSLGAPFFTLFTILLIQLYGCAPTAVQLKESLVATEPCCKDFRQLRYQALDYGADKPLKLNLTISENSDVYAFKTGRSFAQGFILPPFSGPYEITLQSFLSGGLTLDSSYLFYPLVAVLNDSYRVQRIHQVPRQKVVTSLEQDFVKGLHLPLTIPIRRRDKYLVIYTDPGLLDKTFRYVEHTSSTSTAYTPYGSFLVTTPIHIDKKIPFAAGGELRLIIDKTKKMH